MTKFLKTKWQLLCICLVSLVMFFPSLFKFYTNDDFWFLKIANVSSFKEFLNFFNLLKDTENIGVYRPLTLRVYYFLGVKLFNLNPIPLHIISFIVFFIIIFLVAKLAILLTNNNKIAVLSSFLYAVSVTHFGQLYYVGAFQELCLTALFLASVIYFIEYETQVRHPVEKLTVSFLLFILALMSKETAVVLPFILILIHVYFSLIKRTMTSTKTLVLSLTAYFLVLAIYLFFHFHNFGLISGDSYVWDFSPTRAINSLVWYGLWSFNLPEMLIDFVGPGLHFNPNLFTFWSKEIIPILTFFALEVFVFITALFKSYRNVSKKVLTFKFYLLTFCTIWFVATLAPVLFLPVHKFTYYLTLPLVGVVFIISHLLSNLKTRICIIFCVVWLVTSFFSLRLTLETNWIIQGENVSARVYQYFSQNKLNSSHKNIEFIDTPDDTSLPWSPTTTLKTVLSNQNLFNVFFSNYSGKINYAGLGKISNTTGAEIVKSRQFLGY